jgi:hypothetical protein
MTIRHKSITSTNMIQIPIKLNINNRFHASSRKSYIFKVDRHLLLIIIFTEFYRKKIDVKKISQKVCLILGKKNDKANKKTYNQNYVTNYMCT